MRYILNDEGYIETISFSNEIECNNKTCTEYTGTIPEGYSSLVEWSENAVIQAYKIIDGNLTHDANKETALLSEWEKQTGHRILKEGAWFMHDEHIIDLSTTPISKQPNGILLVFSAYEDGAKDQEFEEFFISKKIVSLHNGKGHSFFFNSSAFGTVGAKYLYIYDNKITGHANNTKSGTATTSGITYNNKYWVLRYVIGV